MLLAYLTYRLGIIHSIRFLCLTILLIFAEIKITLGGTYLNELLSYNHQSILFYCILIWITLSFEIYFFLDRLFASISIKARITVQVLSLLLCVCYLLACSFTLYGFIKSSDGHVITETDFFYPPLTNITLSANCNPYRFIGIVSGYLIGFLYLAVFVLIRCSTG
ncbi:unnamed protein product [Adineta ricciae]|uniref:Uncharacterized protein n=1 Tax=Adineta ricciae TaxID=249248 RepID=A0A815NIP7_ADIRI|nr:unnamed protein product [Adineta ricciae]CAF1434385.1 unnamed protein product [Adineta ricciae]